MYLPGLTLAGSVAGLPARCPNVASAVPGILISLRCLRAAKDAGARALPAVGRARSLDVMRRGLAGSWYWHVVSFEIDCSPAPCPTVRPWQSVAEPGSRPAAGHQSRRRQCRSWPWWRILDVQNDAPPVPDIVCSTRSDRHDAWTVVRELGDHRQIDVEMLRDKSRRGMGQQVGQRHLGVIGAAEHLQVH